MRFELVVTAYELWERYKGAGARTLALLSELLRTKNLLRSSYTRRVLRSLLVAAAAT
jgi:hypothetical protein